MSNQIYIYPRDFGCTAVPKPFTLVYDIDSERLLCGDGKRNIMELLGGCALPKEVEDPEATVIQAINRPADVNSDGVVDEQDLSIVHKEYSKDVKKKTAKKKAASKKDK